MKNELMIVWTTDNRDTILNMICLYALNAKTKGWFDEVTILVWELLNKYLVKIKR